MTGSVPPPADTAAEVPYLVEPGWVRADVVGDGTHSFRLLWWSGTKIGFEHLCDRGQRGVIVCAPLLTNVGQPGGHHITWSLLGSGRMAPTVRASILCPDCGIHGFVTDGRWAGA